MDASLTADGWSRPCRIVDIGHGGARVALDGAPPCNREVRIHHPFAGSVYGSRVWSAGNTVGIVFNAPARARPLLALCRQRAVVEPRRLSAATPAATGNTARRDDSPVAAAHVVVRLTNY